MLTGRGMLTWGGQSAFSFRGCRVSQAFVAEFCCMLWLKNLTSGRATYKDGQMEGEARPCAAVKGTQISVRASSYLQAITISSSVQYMMGGFSC